MDINKFYFKRKVTEKGTKKLWAAWPGLGPLVFLIQGHDCDIENQDKCETYEIGRIDRSTKIQSPTATRKSIQTYQKKSSGDLLHCGFFPLFGLKTTNSCRQNPSQPQHFDAATQDAVDPWNDLEIQMVGPRNALLESVREPMVGTRRNKKKTWSKKAVLGVTGSCSPQKESNDVTERFWDTHNEIVR